MRPQPTALPVRTACDDFQVENNCPSNYLRDNVAFDSETDDDDLLETVIAFYRERLKEQPPALKYLESRGLTEPELLDTFEIGFADRALGRALPKTCLAAGKRMRSCLQRLGIYRDTGHGHFNGCIVVPIRTAQGRIAQVYGRKIARHVSGTPHVTMSGNSAGGLLNAGALQACDEIIVTDSVLNVLTFWSAGVRNVTALLPPNGPAGPSDPDAPSGRLTSLRAWFKWLTRQRVILHNPASELELPRIGHRLPKHVLSESDVEAVLSVPDIEKPLGIRDRAILETSYSTGIRRFELVGLRVDAVDSERGVLTVRQGKGKKDRVVPIGDRALGWLEKYRLDVRPTFCIDSNEAAVFLTRMGEPFSESAMSALVHDYIARAQTGKTGSCHLFATQWPH